MTTYVAGENGLRLGADFYASGQPVPVTEIPNLSRLLRIDVLVPADEVHGGWEARRRMRFQRREYGVGDRLPPEFRLVHNFSRLVEMGWVRLVEKPEPERVNGAHREPPRVRRRRKRRGRRHVV